MVEVGPRGSTAAQKDLEVRWELGELWSYCTGWWQYSNAATHFIHTWYPHRHLFHLERSCQLAHNSFPDPRPAPGHQHGWWSKESVMDGVSVHYLLLSLQVLYLDWTANLLWPNLWTLHPQFQSASTGPHGSFGMMDNGRRHSHDVHAGSDYVGFRQITVARGSSCVECDHVVVYVPTSFPGDLGAWSSPTQL